MNVCRDAAVTFTPLSPVGEEAISCSSDLWSELDFSPMETEAKRTGGRREAGRRRWRGEVSEAANEVGTAT